MNISDGKNASLCIDSRLKDKYVGSGFWPYYGESRNFKVGQLLLAFYKLGYGGNRYLFVEAGVISNIPAYENRHAAEYTPYDKLQKYKGRLIIDIYKGNTQGRYCFNLKTYYSKIKVDEILPEIYGGDAFPGFNNLRLSYEELYRVIYLGIGWKEALKSQKGIYVITDKAPKNEYSGLGRIYVGSATSQSQMLHDRWECYARTLTGGNKELKKVVVLKGEDYIKKYFQWSLIEHFDESISDSYILEREKYWKQVFNSKEEGLNDNY